MRTLWTALLSVALLAFAPAAQGELTQEAFDWWYNQMACLVDEIGTRWIGTEGHENARAYLIGQFEAAGMSYEDGTLWESECEVDGVAASSIIGVKRALSESPQIVTVCAHYDSHSPGARDNASGVATVLTLMRYFSELPPYPDTELRFIAFSAEETGHQGSLGYLDELTQDELLRSLAAFNVDILVVDVWDTEAAFSVDTLGYRKGSAPYYDGTEASPAVNVPVRAILRAMDKVGGFAPEDEGVTWCVPRHLGMSDHESFHFFTVDAANVCFRGNVAQGGRWPEFMHTPSDVMGDFDLDRSWQALEVLLTAVEGLCADHAYGS